LTKTLRQAVKVGAFLGELVTLLELYVQTLLAPGPFNTEAITTIGLLATVSCAFAYLSSSLFRYQAADTKPLRLRQVIAKPPFVVWIVVVVIISVQLANGLIRPEPVLA